MRTLQLYKIADEIQACLAMTEDGELMLDAEKRLNELELTFAKKAEAVLQFREGLVATHDALTREINRLSAFKESVSRSVDRLRAYLMECMQDLGMKKLDTDTHKVWIQNNSRPNIELKADQNIPEKFKRITVTFDSQAAYEYWKSGGTLPDSITVTLGQHLRIR